MTTTSSAEQEAENIRNCLKMIRCLDTMPGDILPNGKTASATAHEYVMHGKIKRCVYKRKDYNPRKKRPYERKRKGGRDVRSTN